MEMEKILEAKQNREQNQTKTFKRIEETKTEVQHWQNLLVHLAQVTQSFFFASLWIYFYEIDLYF